ncbi:sodium-dependent transporter [Catenovulum sp. 2E275]|uniref:sodium-dependent transporter n=1 Tax=Catenovulum sp. 2E275 TaxID=2980497 RepID=UPI0021CE078C|nr:sodium-dependent transporter [Catenovulum sp. 2E275]MCU4674685.1 sodium-dependent transporter [Catenovulum sp. 2E275]
MSKVNKTHAQWSNRFAYILAATGAAVGLGNIWKFPYIVGENGGGAFVLVYLFCIAIVGVPVMIAEVYLGKKGRQSPMRAVATIAKQYSVSNCWKYAGGMGVAAGYLILSFYAVIAGWACAYVLQSATGQFDNATPAQIQTGFAELTSSPLTLIGWTTFMLAITAAVVAKGLQQGLERCVRYMMPAMFILLLVIAGYSASYGDFSQALSFMFEPDFSKLTVHAVLEALGHSFFTLSLASGVMIMYGAYLPDETSIVKTSIWIAIADTLVALLAGLAIFPIVFENNLTPSAGPSLIFETLPLAFGQMPGGQIIGTVFFVMLVFAAFTSAIALIESSVAWFVEKKGYGRVASAVLSATGLWLLSLLSIFSFTGATWANFDIMSLQFSLFDVIDKLTSNIMLPLGGLLIAIFVGWKVRQNDLAAELKLPENAFKLSFILLKYVTPAIVLIVFIYMTRIINLFK